MMGESGPLVDCLRSVEGLGTLSGDLLRDLAAEMTLVTLADGDTLIRQNQTGATFCAIVSGALSVTWIDRHGSERTRPDVEPGQTVGEVSVLSDTPALETMRARGTVQVAQLPRAGFERFAARSPAGVLALVDALRRQLHRHSFRFTLHRTEAFRDLDQRLLNDLETELQPMSLYGGEMLIRQGEPGDSVYIVISGRLRVVRRSAQGGDVVLAELGPGETVGEMALVSSEARSADVYAIRDSQVASLSKRAVERLLVRHPMAALHMLARGPVARVRNMSSGRPQVAPLSTIAIVPAGPDAPLREFGARLSAGLARLGKTLHVTSELVDARLARTGAAQAYDRHGAAGQLVEWLAEQEIEHRFVLYQSDMSCTPWTERSVRQADHVVLVASATGDASQWEIERNVLDGSTSRTGVTLVLVHKSGASPSNTARWLSGRRLDRHLHVHLDDREDIDRVSRLVTGHGVGLALGGGFARGLAHLGVLRACRELGIPIDAIGGSSMGAMVGALHVLGWDHDSILNATVQGLAKSFDDMTLPFVAFKRGGRYSRQVQTFFGDTQIEDLWLPYFCTSTNLNRAELKVHTVGSLATGVLATTRAPAVFPPLVIDGELHVDGGLVNNVPVDVMSKVANRGPVIGVDVSPPHQLHRVPDYGHDISGWRAIWNRFHPTRHKRAYRPSILLVLVRLIEFGGIAYRERIAGQADLYISPDVLRFRRNDFSLAGEIVEVGYQTAHASLSAWLKAIAEQTDVGRFRGLPRPAELDEKAAV